MLKFIDVRLSIPARLALIGSLFVVPIVFLTYIFLDQSSGDIGFAEKEIAGTHYLAEIWPQFAKASQSGRLSQGDSPDRPRYDAEFNTADASSAFAAAADLSAKLEAGKTLIGAVADNSNLTLDPDLDSFYAMDAATVRIPAIAAAAVALGEAVAEPVADPARIVHIAFAVDHLQTSSDEAAASLASAMKGNAAGDTGRALSAHASALKVAANDLLEEGRALLDRREAKDLDAAQAKLLSEVDAAWGPTNAEVARLLQARIDGFYHKIASNLAFAGLFVAAATLLSFTIARGLTVRMTALLTAMDRLVSGDHSVKIPFGADRNETGRIAAALEAFKRSLVERSTLQSEKSLVEELAAERRRNEAARDAVVREQARVVNLIADGLGRLARADLTISLNERFPSEFERLRVDMNDAAEQLRKAMMEVASAGRSIHTGVDEIAAAVDNLQGRTEQQAASLEQTAAAIEEITATVKKSASGAGEARELVAAADENAKRSADVVARAVEAMAGIAKSAQQISPIIGLMDEIAFQTNLLALNAGVEAARAGEAGRGFAVVASEVRSLAQRSAEAAKEIKGLISTSGTQVDLGVKLVAETGKSLEQILAQVAQINSVVATIATSASEQATGLAEISTAINQMDQTTQQNAAMVEQCTAGCRSLCGETEQMSALIARFQTGESRGDEFARRTPTKSAAKSKAEMAPRPRTPAGRHAA